MSDKYTPTIGIECHVQLKTKTKLFAGVSNVATDAKPNSLISHICLGMPGALPVLNKHAVELVSKAAFALNTKPQKFSKFDRKHYFYPDLPKGYQISQFKYPLILGGEVLITVDGQEKRIGITRAHLEEDAGKSTHPANKDYSLVDLNRAGTPLLEIVSEPDMHSAKEARQYVNQLYLLMKYADITEGDLYHGNIRFDVNISVSDNPKELGNRCEIKNLNSFRAVEKAVEYEIKRQTGELQKGGAISQETRGWDEAKQKTFSQRTKEESHDYRYFPDPDLPPVILDDEFIKSQYAIYKKRNYNTISELLLGAGVARSDLIIFFGYGPEFVDFAVDVVKTSKSKNLEASTIIDWLVNIIPPILEDNSSISRYRNKIDDLFVLAGAFLEKKINSSKVKQALSSIFSDEKFDLGYFISSHSVISDDKQIQDIINKVLKDNPKALEDIKNGEMKVIGFLVGQVMKASGGKVDPGLVNKMIKDQLKV